MAEPIDPLPHPVLGDRFADAFAYAVHLHARQARKGTAISYLTHSSWLMQTDGAPVEAWPYRLMPEYGPEGSVLPLPAKGNEVRIATIFRYKGLESPVVILAEIDGRVAADELAALIYVGATRARAHLVLVASDELSRRLGADSQ